MRLLIAGGGTGGHIYPALAVARSLRARPDGADLHWLGGHRGLEASLVPAAGIPLRRLALLTLDTIRQLKEAYEILFRHELNMQQAMTRVREENLDGVPEVAELTAFVASTKRGITRETLEH